MKKKKKLQPSRNKIKSTNIDKRKNKYLIKKKTTFFFAVLWNIFVIHVIKEENKYIYRSFCA